MSKRRISLGDQIRQAVRDTPTTHLALCRATGIDKAAMSRFMAGKVGMTLANLDKLAALLDFHVAAGKGSKSRRKG